MSACDEWEGYRDANGYGKVSFWWEGKSHLVLAHRLVWMQDNGPIPDGLVVMHLCDNPPCINLEHLRLGTPTDNQRDSVNKGRDYSPYRGVTRCVNGHEFTAANTYNYVTKDGINHRHCRACRRRNVARSAAKKAAS